MVPVEYLVLMLMNGVLPRKRQLEFVACCFACP